MAGIGRRDYNDDDLGDEITVDPIGFTAPRGGHRCVARQSFGMMHVVCHETRNARRPGFHAGIVIDAFKWSWVLT